VVVHDQLRDIAQLPAGGRQIHRHPVLLPGEEHHRVESAHGQERLPAHDRTAGRETENRFAGSIAGGVQG
jgi:hypothetical protein